MTNTQKQSIIDAVTAEFARREWFAGVDFSKEPNMTDTLIIGYNHYPAFELVSFKTSMMKYGVSFELKDIKNILPDSRKDEIPSYMRR